MPDNTTPPAKAIAAARAEGFAAATARVSAVLDSEFFQGREPLAAKLLANDKLSADEIIAALSTTAPAAGGASIPARGNLH